MSVTRILLGGTPSMSTNDAKVRSSEHDYEVFGKYCLVDITE